MDFIGLVMWSGLQGCEEKDIKAQKIFFWVIFLNKDHQPHVVTNKVIFHEFYFFFVSCTIFFLIRECVLYSLFDELLSISFFFLFFFVSFFFIFQFFFFFSFSYFFLFLRSFRCTHCLMCMFLGFQDLLMILLS